MRFRVYGLDAVSHLMLSVNREWHQMVSNNIRFGFASWCVRFSLKVWFVCRHNHQPLSILGRMILARIARPFGFDGNIHTHTNTHVLITPQRTIQKVFVFFVAHTQIEQDLRFWSNRMRTTTGNVDGLWAHKVYFDETKNEQTKKRKFQTGNHIIRCPAHLLRLSPKQTSQHAPSRYGSFWSECNTAWQWKYTKHRTYFFFGIVWETKSN